MDRLENDEAQARLAKLAELYDAGRYDEAITLGESMLELPNSAYRSARTSFLVAMAYLQRGRPDLGKGPLARATEHFTAVQDKEMLAECTGAEASIALLEHRPDAVELARQAVRACRALKEIPNGLELRTLNGLAVALYLFGERSEAIKTFEEAIERADPVVDMRRLGKLLDCAGVAYRELGHMGKAANFGERAVALFETLRDVVSLGTAENNLGWALIGCGLLTSARKHLNRALQLFDETNRLGIRSALLGSFCELSVAEGNLEQALAHADAAIEVGEGQNETWYVAEARIWKGRIAAKLSDDGGVDSEFHSALVILGDSGMTHRLIECHAEYAEILERRGDLPRAYEHMKAAVQNQRMRLQQAL